MGGFGDYSKNEKKKIAKSKLEERAKKSMMQTGTTGFVLPKIIERKRG